MLDGNTAFITEGGPWNLSEEDELTVGFKMLTANNPQYPQFIGEYGENGGDGEGVGMREIAVSDNYVYALGWDFGLTVIDVSDPGNPDRVDFVRGRFTSVDVSENTAYLTTEDEVVLMDISNPEEVEEISRLDVGLNIQYVADIIATEDFLNIAIGREGLLTIDVSDPEEMAIVYRREFEYIYGLDIIDDHAFMTVIFDETHGMLILDISNPQEPEEITYFEPEWGPGRIDVEGDFALLSASRNSLRLLDISDLENPQEVGFLEEQWGYDVALRDHFALATTGEHLKVFNCAGAMGIPRPPEWVEIPGQISLTETDTIEFVVSAWDPNDDEIQLELRGGNLPEEASFEDNGNGTGVFRWETGYEAEGDYRPAFVAISGEDETVRVVTIEVLNLNRSPMLARPLADVIFPEDPGEITIADLDTIFNDPDDDRLRYLLSGAPEELNIFVLGSSLRVRPRTNYNLPEGAEIALTCLDPDSALARDTLRVALTPVNDAPAQFGLLEPTNRSVIVDFQTDFVWRSAEDVDEDTLGYRLWLKLYHDEIDTAFTWEAGSDTSYSLRQIDTIVVNLGIEARLSATWWVEASDAELSVESSSRRFITIPEVLAAGSNQLELPTEFSLGSAYPNPFNLNTIIPYALPKQASVKIDVFNITGSHVTTILNEEQSAGYQSILWSADHLDSGVYFIRLQSPGYYGVEKVIFLK